MNTAHVVMGEIIPTTNECFYPSTTCHHQYSGHSSSKSHYHHHHLISSSTSNSTVPPHQHENPTMDIFAIHSIVLEGDELDNHTPWRGRMMDEEESSSSSTCSSSGGGTNNCFGGEALIEEALGVRVPSSSSSSCVIRRRNHVKFSQVRVQEHGLVVADEESFEFHVHLDWAHAEEKNYSVEDYEVQKIIKKSSSSSSSISSMPTPRRLTRAERRQRLHQVHGTGSSNNSKSSGWGRRCDLLLDKLDGDSCCFSGDHRQWRRDVLMDKVVGGGDDGDSSFMDKQRARFIASSRTSAFAGLSSISGRLQDHVPAVVSPYFREAVAAASNDLNRPWHELSFGSL
jgi:hypothetical protein